MIKEIVSGAPSLPFLAVVVRSVLLYLSVIIATRIMGKRQVGIISGHNYLVAAGIVSLVAVRMVNPKTSLVSGLVIVFTYALVNRLWSFLDLKFPRLIDRKAITLMENGLILLKGLKKVHLSVDDLMMMLRQKKIWNLSAVHQVLLEPTGQISVLMKDPNQAVTAKDIGLKTSAINNPAQLIYFQKNQNEEALTQSLINQQKEKAPSDSVGFIVNPDNTVTYIKEG